MHTIRNLEVEDYEKGYLNLLENLTVVEPENITQNMFCQFVKQLNINHVVYVIEHENQIIGSGTVLIEQKIIHGCGKVAHIEDIVVSPLHTGKQLGSFIIQALVNYAKEQKCYKVILDCNESLIKFYNKNGFEKKGLEMGLYF